MEAAEQGTPQKSVTLSWLKMVDNSGKSGGKSDSSEIATPSYKYAATTSTNSKNKKLLHPRTPSGSSSGSFASTVSTSSNTGASSSCSFHLFSQSTAVFGTPPAKRFQRVRNPFETALAERLHLPLIGSPSLFQRPVTPQLSSTQFEWTIEEVSSLKPANVEAHETQFQDSPDPDYEAKAQSAISSYFTGQIVPSPVDCPLRSQRIILSELNGNTPISKPGRRIRDWGTQTALTLPPVLPAALEEALRPYLQPHLATDEHCLAGLELQRTSTSCYTAITENKDVSLRRKLFDIHNIVVLDNEENLPPFAANAGASGSARTQTNSSPLSITGLQDTAIAGKLSDSIDKRYFGSLSSLSCTDGLSNSSHSPLLQEDNSESGNSSNAKRKSRVRSFLLQEVEDLSPIHAPEGSELSRRRAHAQNQYRTHAQHTIEHTSGDVSRDSSLNKFADDTKFTPDHSSSPLLSNMERAELSTDSSFNFKVSRLVVNSSRCGSTEAKARSKLFARSATEVEFFPHDDTDELLDGDEDDMQVSQLSAQSSNCSSSNSDTPRGKRRSASRKNLSQSFSANWLEEAEEQAAAMVALTEQEHIQVPKVAIPKINELLLQTENTTTNVMPKENNKLSPDCSRASFYRTDSGFNELTTSSCSSALQQQQHCSPKSCAQQELDVSMVCCSTPAKCGDNTSNTSF